MLDTQFLLNYRLFISVILCAVFLTGSLMALYQVLAKHKNGVYNAMSLLCFITSVFWAIVVFISYIDVCGNSAIRDLSLLLLDTVTTLIVVSFLILGVKLVRSD